MLINARPALCGSILMGQQSFRVLVVALGALGTLLAGCQAGGLQITNTSNKDVTFTQDRPGGEVATTLHPGSSMTLPAGSRINMGDFMVEDR